MWEALLLICWAPMALLVAHAASEGIHALVAAYEAGPLELSTAPLVAFFWVAAAAVAAKAMSSGLKRAAGVLLSRERDRPSLESKLYAAPGLKARVRLEP